MSASFRILHVITGINRGGAENHLAELVRHQRSLGAEVTVAYLRGNGYWAPEFRSLGAHVQSLGLRFYGDPRPLALLRRTIAHGGFDLVHAHLPPAELYVRIALLGIPQKQLPLIISKHNDCPFHPVLPGELHLDRWVSRRATGMIFISEAVGRYMKRRRLGLASCRSFVIPYGIDVTPFLGVTSSERAALRAAWGVGPNTLLIGFVGRLVPQKALHTLLRAFALFLERTSMDAKLVIVGEGPLQRDLQDLAESLGVDRRTIWPGFLEEIPSVMHAFDIFALTSIFEGFGLVLVEAMAAGCPVVATRAGAIPEVVVENETALLAEVENANAIADAFVQLKEAPLRARLGAAGRQRVHSRFSLCRMLKATDAAYAQCLGWSPHKLHQDNTLVSMSA